MTFGYAARRLVHRATLKLFPLFEWMGVHVVPAHFYYPIPHTRDLPDKVFTRISDSPGLDWNTSRQLEYLRSIFPNYAVERAFEPNTGLNVVDAAIFYAMIRHHKPRRLIEVGSGSSTLIAASACLQNTAEGHPCEYIAIDPFPTVAVKRGVTGLSALWTRRVQDVELSAFADCDMLFIDSSHVAGIGSDVTFEQLEVLPRLRPGCLVHFHDILLPGEYWKDWVMGERFFWTEQYLLHAFLLFNRAFQLEWASRFMQLTHSADVLATFPGYREDFRMTSFWIRRVPEGSA